MSSSVTTSFRAVVALVLSLFATTILVDTAQAQNDLSDIQFVLASSSGDESANASLAISWTGTMSADALTLNISTAGTGSDPAGASDFTAVTTLVIPGSSSSPQNLSITINDDGLDENAEAILATITGIDSYAGGTSALGGQVTHTYTINDNDNPPTVTFDTDLAEGENLSATALRATLSVASGLDVTVPYTINGSSTATGSGTDYTIDASPLVISAGNTFGDITITYNDDLLDEVDETIVVDMTTGSLVNATAGATTTHTRTIQDNDLVVVSFAAASSAADESNADQPITISFDQAPAVAFTINFSTGGTATGGGADFTEVASVSSGTGSTTLELPSLAVVNDTDPEGDETVIITIDNDAAYAVDTPNPHTYTIQDAWDFGDAPTTAQSGFGADYPVLLADTGAAHDISGSNPVYLGSSVDAEADGQPSSDAGDSAADGDDGTGSDDEDGVVFPTLDSGTVESVPVSITVTGAGGYYVSMWIDFNQNGDWSDPGEQVLNDQVIVALGAGLQASSQSISIPDDAIAGNTYARVRACSATSTCNTDTGNAPNGEVEDYEVLVNVDADLAITKGDSPDPVQAGGAITYTLVVTNNGPAVAEGVIIADVLPSGANLVTLTSSNGVGSMGQACVEASPSPVCTVNADLEVGGTMTVTLNGTVAGTATGSLSNQATTVATTNDPNVGDNTATEITTIIGADYGDAPDSYLTLLASGGPTHATTGVFLGALRDSDADGQVDPAADGDDADGTDDEDGVTFTPIFVDAAVANTASLFITASEAGRVDAWLDGFGGAIDGDFDDPADKIIDDEAVVAGLNTFTITIPAGGATGASFVRVRISSAGGLAPGGPSPDGEVEDYAVELFASGSVALDLDTFPFDTIDTDGAGNVCFSDTGVDLFCVPAADVTDLTVDGTAGDDNVIVDFTNGDPIPNGLAYNAGGQGAGGDELTILGAGAGTTTVTHSFSNSNDGSVDIDGSTITYTGLEPITDNLDPVNRVFTFTSVNATEVITLGDDGTADDGISFIDSDDGESVAFGNPTASLTINAGDGAQTLNLGLLDTSGGLLPTIAVTVNGDADADIFNVTPVPTAAPGPGYTSYALAGGDPTTCTGDIFNVTSGTVDTGVAYTVPSGTVSFTSAHGTITYATMEVLGFASVNLGITSSTFDDNPAYPGDDIVLTAVVTNDAGAANQAQCVVVDLSGFSSVLNATSPPLPAAVVSAGTFDPVTFLWTIPTLNPGASESLNISFVVDTQLSGDFTSNVTIGGSNTEADASDNTLSTALTVGEVFKFPAKAHAQAAVFKTLSSGLERMVLGLYGGSPGINGAVWCRVPEPDGVVFTVTGMPTVYKTCSEGTPSVGGTAIPLYVNDLWLDETGTNAGRIYMTTWGSEGLYYSDDDGETWVGIEPDLGDGYAGAGGWVNVYAITEDATDGILYISANNGLVFRSLNNGTSWQQVSSLPEGAADTPWSLLAHPNPLASGTVFAGTAGKGVYVSTDFGISWNQLADNATLQAADADYIFDLEMREDGAFDYLFAGTSRGVWRMDYAGAQTWAELDTDQEMVTPTLQNPEVRSIEFGDVDQNGNEELYAVTWGFGVLRHDDPFAAAPVAGDLNQYALRGAEVTMFALAPSGALFLATSGGEIHEMDPMNPDLGAEATEVEPIAQDVPDGYSLEQNYPNPFNPQTTIRFGMKDSGKVRLVVVDMLGRVVTTLVDTQMAAGTHEVVFDAANLPSGSYLYRLETETTTVTRILSLLK